MTFSKFLGLAVFPLGLALSACSVDSHRNKDLGTAPDFSRAGGTNFYVDALAVTRSDLAGFNSYGLPKKKMFNFKSCILDNTGAPINTANVPFRISDDNGGTIERSTDIHGCLTWSETHDYNYLEEETYFKLSRVIAPKAIYKGSVHIDVAFDPWADGAAAVVDPRTQSLIGNAKLNDIGPLSVRGAHVAQLNQTPSLNVNIDVVNFDFNGFDYDQYEVSPELDLKIAHKYLVRFKPTVIRKTISKAATSESFTGGQLKVVFAIFREQKDLAHQFDPENMISSNEFTVSDDKMVGTFAANTVLKFDKFVELTSRTAALVTFVPVGDVSGLGELSFQGILKPGRLAALNLVPSKLNARALVAQAELLKTHQSPRPLTKYVADHGLRFMNLAPATLPTWGGFLPPRTVDLNSEIVGLLRDPQHKLSKEASQVLCRQLYASYSDVDTLCALNWSSVTQVQRPVFVEQVLSSPRKVGVTTLKTLKVSVAFSEAKSDTTTTSNKFLADAGISGNLGLSTPSLPDALNFGKMLSAGIGIKLTVSDDLSYVREWKDVDTSSSTVTASTDASVTSEGNSFQFEASVRPCVVVSPLAGNGLNPKVAGQVKPIYACSSQPTNKTVSESFYLMGQTIGNAGSPFSDPDGNGETTWRMLVRGQRNSLALDNFLVNHKNLNLILQKLPGKKALSDFTIQNGPGILSEE